MTVISNESIAINAEIYWKSQYWRIVHRNSDWLVIEKDTKLKILALGKMKTSRGGKQHLYKGREQYVLNNGNLFYLYKKRRQRLWRITRYSPLNSWKFSPVLKFLIDNKYHINYPKSIYKFIKKYTSDKAAKKICDQVCGNFKLDNTTLNIIWYLNRMHKNFPRGRAILTRALEQHTLTPEQALHTIRSISRGIRE